MNQRQLHKRLYPDFYVAWQEWLDMPYGHMRNFVKSELAEDEIRAELKKLVDKKMTKNGRKYWRELETI